MKNTAGVYLTAGAPSPRRESNSNIKEKGDREKNWDSVHQKLSFTKNFSNSALAA